MTFYGSYIAINRYTLLSFSLPDTQTSVQELKYTVMMKQ